MSTSCPICHSTRSTLAVARRESAQQLEVLRCGDCHHAWLAAGCTAFAADVYAYYRRLLGTPRHELYNPLNTQRQEQLLMHLGRFTRGRRLLDVGCGDGHLVATATDAGWVARGIDLSESAVELCRSVGLSCDVLDFFDARLDGERFDAIVMSELIEHVGEPGRFLTRAGKLLEPGGVLYLTTPNFDAASRRMLGGHWRVIHPEHVSYFCDQSLRRLVAAAPDLHLRELHSRNIAAGTLARSLRDRALRRPPVATGASGAGWNADQRMRAQIASSRVLQGAKAVLNAALDVSKAGDTLVAVLQKTSG